MKKLPVYYKGRIVHWAKVDDRDYPSLRERRWCWAPLRGGYVRQGTREAKRRGESRYLARALLRPPKHMVADHINHDPLDNRRANLRIITWAKNVRHRRGPQRNNSSGILGVYLHSTGTGWNARITVNGKTLGKFFGFSTYGLAAKTEAEKFSMKLRSQYT